MGWPNGESVVVNSGTRWLRMPIEWHDIQPFQPLTLTANPEDPTYRWSSYDHNISQMSADGFEIMATLVGSPAWAAELPQGPVNNTQALADFVQALVERYDGDGIGDAPGSPVITYWEFFNEPDSTDRQMGMEDRGAVFGYTNGLYSTNILQTVYTPVKEANTQAQVVMGGIAYDSYVEDGGVFDRGFLTDTLRTGGCGYFDIMNFHSYPYYDWRWQSLGGDVMGKASSIRSILSNFGCNKPLALTEVGDYIGGDGVWPFTRERQANYVVKGLIRAIAADLSPIIWYRFRDIPNSDYGLVDDNLNTQLGYQAMQVLIQQLSGAQFRSIGQTMAPQSPTSGLEIFTFQIGTRQRQVMWTDCVPVWSGCTPPVITKRLATTSVTVTTRDGVTSTVRDCDDGACDGYVALQVSDPIYVDVSAQPVYIPFVQR